jgi:choline transport protein
VVSQLLSLENKSTHSLIFCTVTLATGIGAIPLGSSTAFIDLTGSFIILTSISYAIPIAANMATGRRHLPKGSFNLGKSALFVNGAAVVFIIFFDIFYCFRRFISLHLVVC